MSSSEELLSTEQNKLIQNDNFIPVYQPYMGSLEKSYLLDAIDSGWISSKGKYLTQFEQEFARKINTPFASAVSNGTVAIHLALIALGIGPGDEVIVPTFTYVATVNPIIQVGATPIFVDSLIDSWQINPEQIKKNITNKTKAIIIAHLYGQACEMAAIVDLAKEYNLYLIEDCAEAFGTYYNNKHVGTFGDIGTFSFYGNKTITTGEGGMLVTHNANLMDKIVFYKGQGLDKNKRYWHTDVGYNYRMTNLAAAIGCAQLEKSSEILKMKRVIADIYFEEFANTKIIMHREQQNSTHSYWMISILLPENYSRDELINYLAINNIETRPTFYPIHTMPMYLNYPSSKNNFSIATFLSSQGLNLPSWPGLSEQQIKKISTHIINFLNSQR